MDNINNKIEKSRLYNSFAVKLDDIASSLLLTDPDGKENILLCVQNYVEKIFIKNAMEISNNNISKASKLLGINRNTLSKKLRNI
ncbi:MAG: hypothetical protein KBE27_01670 [Syntrophorhabdaceae bacterium]|jgi:DNA-binding protein Fis|nr:hypothetical protein [Syntrophorhabdaceae bacterium]